MTNFIIRHRLPLFAFIAVVACVTACDDSTNVTENSGINTIVSTYTELGKCTAENEGDVIFVKDSSALYFCVDSVWKVMSTVDDSTRKAPVSCSMEELNDGSGYKIECGGDSIGVVYNGEKGDDGLSGIRGRKGDKGDKGDDGRDGKSCTAVALADSSGYKIICGMDSVGVVLNGKKGDKGDKGDDGKSCTAEILDDSTGFKIVCGTDSVGVVLNGQDGSEGKSCNAEALADSTGYKIVCGTDSVGVVLNGNAESVESCNFVEGESGLVTLTCGDRSVTFTSLSFCGNIPYNSKTHFCDLRTPAVYRFVTIGEGENEQTWMAENANYETTSGSACYDNQPANCARYGRLYDWSAAKEACPKGWHLPDTTEFITLFKNVGGVPLSATERANVNALNSDYRCLNVAGKKLKTEYGWGENSVGVDTYGFSVLPAGIYNGGFDFIGTNTDIWTSSEGVSNDAFVIEFYSVNSYLPVDGVCWLDHSEEVKRSVRCLKDSTNP